MFCKECGTEVPQEARFCPSCGEELAKQEPDPEEIAQEVGAIEAQPPQPNALPTPTSLPTPMAQPVGGQSGVVGGTFASPGGVGTASSGIAPVEQSAPAATLQTPSSAPTSPAEPLPTAGQVPAAAQSTPVVPTPSQGTPPPVTSGKKTGTTCLIIGCVALFMIVVLGVIGFGILAYFRTSKVEVTSEQSKETVVVDDGTASASSEGDVKADESQIDGATPVESDANAASRALHSFLIALEKGNTAAIQAAIAENAVTSFDPALWGQGDAQHLDFDVLTTKSDGSGGWKYTIKETLRDMADGTKFTESYDIRIENINGEWLVTEFGDMN